MIKIGNAQAFWGDSPGAPKRLLEQVPDLDYLTLDYLAELTLSIMAAQRKKDPSKGYAHDFVEVVRSLIPHWEKGAHVKVVANAGGLNPYGCLEALAPYCKGMKVGVVSGDDVKEVFPDYETANAYLGSSPISEALKKGAQIVLTGRVADPCLTAAPCLAHFGWEENAYDKIAQATVAGHLIECGTQATGGMSTHWLEIPDPARIGYPIVEMEEDASFVITKPAHTGGEVSERTVKEQLLYEIGDPARYLSPDATVSFLSLALSDEGKDRIGIHGAKGTPPPSFYKVSASKPEGFKVEGMLTIYGERPAEKGEKMAAVVRSRVDVEEYFYEVLGKNDPKECVLRIAAADSRREPLEALAKEIAPLVTSGPQGICGYAGGRPKVRAVYGYEALEIERDQVSPRVEVVSL